MKTPANSRYSELDSGKASTELLKKPRNFRGLFRFGISTSGNVGQPQRFEPLPSQPPGISTSGNVGQPQHDIGANELNF